MAIPVKKWKYSSEKWKNDGQVCPKYLSHRNGSSRNIDSEFKT